MIASKGGIGINILNTMGIKTKSKYMKALKEIIEPNTDSVPNDVLEQ
jgi:hypothetical protein